MTEADESRAERPKAKVARPAKPEPKSAWENDSLRRHWVNHPERLAISFDAAHEISQKGLADQPWNKVPRFLMRSWYEREYEKPVEIGKPTRSIVNG